MNGSQCGDEDGEPLQGSADLPRAHADDAERELAAWASLGAKLAEIAPGVLASALDALEFAVAAMGENASEFGNTYDTYN